MADEQLDEKNLNPEEAVAANADARVLELEEQLAAAKDQSLRVAAEAQNSVRRAEQEVDKARKFALEKFAGDLLPVIDSLELALAHSNVEDEQVKKIREGVVARIDDANAMSRLLRVTGMRQPLHPLPAAALVLNSHRLRTV